LSIPTVKDDHYETIIINQLDIPLQKDSSAIIRKIVEIFTFECYNHGIDYIVEGIDLS
jgi:hypothetical protein